MGRRPFPTAAIGAAIALALLVCRPVPARTADIPKEGDLLPALVLKTPERPEERAYLGLKDGETFSIASIDVPVLVIEIYSMY